jgi:hypothetical protein
MAALVFQPHLKTRMGTLRRESFLGCDRNHNSVDCLLEFLGESRTAGFGRALHG